MTNDLVRRGTPHRHAPRRLLAACAVVASATIGAATWALTIDAPNQVAMVSANTVAMLEYRALSMGPIASFAGGSNCDSQFSPSLSNGVLTVTGGGWSSGLHQCTYDLSGSGGSATVSASFLVNGNNNLTASTPTINLLAAGVGTPSQSQLVTIFYTGASPLTNIQLGFEDATGMFQYAGPCLGASCQHTFAAAVSRMGSFQANVFCTPRQSGSASTHVLLGGTPLANLSPVAVTVVCNGLGAGNGTGSDAGMQLLVTAMPNPLNMAAPVGQNANSNLTLTTVGMGTSTLPLIIQGDPSIAFADGTREASVAIIGGASSPLIVRCSPTFTSTQHAVIVAGNGSGSGSGSADTQLTAAIDVYCTGIAANQLFSSPVELDFGQIRVGTSKSLATQVQWANNGLGSGSGSSMEIALDSVPKLALADGIVAFSSAPEMPLMTPHEFKISVTADADRDYANTFTVTGTSGTPSVAIPIKAEFVIASVAVPSEVDLGVVCQNDVTGKEITLRANGRGRLALDAPSLNNLIDFDLAVVTPTAYPIMLEPAEAATVRLVPRASVVTHDATATLQWPTDVDNLNGTSSRIATTNIVMNYRVDGGGAGPRRVVFADTSLNQSSEPSTVTVANCDAAPLEVSRIEISEDFLIDSKDSFALPMGQRKEFAVRFAPGASGRLTGELRFITANETYVVALEGNNPDAPEAVSLYACTCAGGSAGHAAPLGLVLMWLVIGCRRRGR